ncbi:MAG: GntR family transcriptional regulator [Bacillota bacterium]
MTVAVAERRTSDDVERRLIKSVLGGEYPPGTQLPPERELASKMGVARPTLRDALRRLERDGWLTIRKGRPAVVNDFWKTGNLNTLANITGNSDVFHEEFIIYLLEIRAALAPAFIRSAVTKNPARVVAALVESIELEDTPEAFSVFDWEFQKSAAGLAGNPIYPLLLNSFDTLYIKLAGQYFSREEARQASKRFYRRLLASAMASDPVAAESAARDAMEESIHLWKTRIKKP